jgi:ABC-2 type transport system permease protein
VIRTLRILPTMIRVALAEAVAYRAELIIWILSTTMPLIMLPLWQAVAETGPLRGYDGDRFTAYFLSAFVIRQLTAVWAAWQMNQDIRAGTLALRLLRPVHPFVSYAIDSLAPMPLRLLIAVPLAILALALTSGRWLVSDLPSAAVLLPAIVGAWCIAFFANLWIGALGLFLTQSIKLMDAWLAGYFVLSGYLVPLALFPGWLAWLPSWTPFRYQLSFPVELMTGGVSYPEALPLLGAQWAWVLVLAIGCALTWQAGLRRVAVVGG